MDPAPAFRAHGTRRLRRGGVRGSPVQVTLAHGALVIAGDDGAPPLHLPVAAIARMRSGSIARQGGRRYHTILWPAAGDPPIRLSPVLPDIFRYADTVRALAAQVAASHGIAAVERGDTRFGALHGPVLTGTLLVAALAVCASALADQPPHLRWLPALVPAMLFGALYWRYRTVHRPRAVADLVELERQLPR